ncbi:MAG: hypoxanthine phosphoribosyltransferase [Myxococcota bacterium]
MARIETLIDETTLRHRVQQLGTQITEDHAELESELMVVPVLTGSFIFAADLVRHIDLPLSVDFLGLRSYVGTRSSGIVEITKDLTRSLTGRHVLIVEDIVDTGLTMRYLLENLRTRQPASVKLASLLHKPARTEVAVDIDYLGFTIEDVFVVGYGLDFDQRFRNLPFLGLAHPDEAPGAAPESTT